MTLLAVLGLFILGYLIGAAMDAAWTHLMNPPR